MLIKITKTQKISPDGINVVKFSVSPDPIEVDNELATKLIELGAAEAVVIAKPEAPKMETPAPENKMVEKPSSDKKAEFTTPKKKDGK